MKGYVCLHQNGLRIFLHLSVLYLYASSFRLFCLFFSAFVPGTLLVLSVSGGLGPGIQTAAGLQSELDDSQYGKGLAPSVWETCEHV